MIAGLDPTTAVALAIGVMTALTMLLVALAVQAAGSRRFSRRLQAVATRKTASAADRGGPATPVRSLARRESATPGLDAIFRLLPRREALVERLGKTGREISVGQYMVATIATIVVVVLGLFIFAHLGPIPSILFGAALGLFVPHYLIGRMGRRRVAAFIGLFPEAID